MIDLEDSGTETRIGRCKTFLSPGDGGPPVAVAVKRLDAV
jgi:hypothetical protein